MRKSARATAVVAATVLTCGLLGPAAFADPGPGKPAPGPAHGLTPGQAGKPGAPGATGKPSPDAGKPYPGKAEVTRAKKEMERRAEAVSQIGAALAAAGSRAAQADQAAEVAAERFNGARYELAEARKAARKSVKEARRARHRVELQRVGIATLVTQSYQDGTALQGITTFMTGGPPSEIMRRAGVAESAGVSMKQKYDEFARVSRAADRAEEHARKARAQAKRLAKEATTAKDLARYATVAAANARGRIGGTEGRLRAAYAQAEETFTKLAKLREDALKRLKDDDPLNDPGPERPLPPAPKVAQVKIHHGIASDTSMIVPRTYPGPVANPPAADPVKAAKAIAFAKEQLGDMYLWAATGPNRWDCSGLTMGAWAAAGVHLPHYSEAQYLVSTPISAADLQPGDLVFWQGAQERIHHVALYIGDGEILHAERTGEPVKIVKMTDFTPPDYFARPKS